jgi:inositol-phosphate transport system permease protein
MNGAMKRTVSAVLVNAFLVFVSFPIVYMLFWLVKSTLINPVTGGVSMESWGFLHSSAWAATTDIPLVWPILGFTVLFGVLVTVMDVLIAVPAAYSASRLDFKGKVALIKFLFLLQAFPGVVVLIAVFYIMVYMGLVNTLAGVVLLSAASMLPSHVYMLKGFFDSVPWDLEQASMVDGCTRWQAFRAVLLPGVRPGIIVIAVFAFMSAYGEWFLFSVFIFSDSYYTMARTISLLLLSPNQNVPLGAMTAFGVFYTIPIAVFYALSQRILLQIKNIGGKKFI